MRREELDPDANPYASPQAVDPPVTAEKPSASGPPPRNPWLSIWWRPKETILEIVAYEPTYMTRPLAVGIGVWSAVQPTRDLARDYWVQSGFTDPPPAVWAAGMLLGAALGIPLWLLFSWLVAWSAKKHESPAPLPAIRAACAWGALPAAVAGPIMFVYYYATGRWHQIDGWLGGAMALTNGLLSLWAIRGLAKGIGGVCEASDQRALGILLLAFLPVAFLIGATTEVVNLIFLP